MRTLQTFVSGYPTKTAAANALGISLPYLLDLLVGQRNFSDNILAKLGLEKIEQVTHKKR